ncbi:MAG: hypothetical protein AB1805_04845 [Nitrospirota bacterium]
MDTWESWPPQRFFYLFIGLAYLMLWVQVLLFHWRGAFRHWSMWGPVLFAPVLAVMGILYSFMYGGWLNWLFVILFAVGAIEGILGALFHFKGVKHYIGGFSLRNFMVGPPPILPMMFMTLSLVALLVYFAWPGPVTGPAGGGYAFIP